MRILPDIAALADLPSGVELAIGVFDGVHRGHQAVIGSAVERGGTPVVITFDPHPIRVLRPERAPLEVTRLAHKLRLLAELGVRHVLPLRFDAERAQEPAEAFVREITSAGNVAGISVGSGFRFGHDRQGDVGLLTELGAELGFTATGVPPVCDAGGKVISSTRVRAALAAGDWESIRALLGRDYSVFGEVETGRRLGRSIGFPTANIRALPGQLPPFGVYAVRAGWGGDTRPGVANLGVRPTVESAAVAPQLEVHLFDFDDEIYGEQLDVHFVEPIRREQKFDGIEPLRAQIAKDVEAARAIAARWSAGGRWPLG